MEAVVYGTEDCGWCESVVRSLKKHTTSVTKVNVREPDNLAEMKKFAGKDAKSVPQVVIDGKYIGGYTETERYLNIISLKGLTKKPVEQQLNEDGTIEW
tara:strand:- start:16 stop:312 length:297 start_codon:yes stop_codon:yes gene_type:complete